MKVCIYLADQNPHRDRSLGISNMTGCLIQALSETSELNLELETLVSRSSVRFPDFSRETIVPWRTDRALTRLLTDHFHSAMIQGADILYYPKGFLGLLTPGTGKKVLTIHDTIVQHYADLYPDERSGASYRYWIELMKHSIRRADLILTVSKTAKRQILGFCDRHEICAPPLRVTYEASAYENLEFEDKAEKDDYVLLLASKAPHKRTLDAIKLWSRRDDLPELRLVGSVPDSAGGILDSCPNIARYPFLPDAEFIEAIRRARAMIFPSEIEGFGLPAIEGYYLGTPVCVGAGTAMDEILSVATQCGRFDLTELESLPTALNEVSRLSKRETDEIGAQLRSSYSCRKFAKSVASAFEDVLVS